MTTSILPYNFFAERAILSILINNPYLLEEVKTYLPSKSFYIPAHNIIYKTLLDLKEKALKINAIILITALEDKNLLEKCGGTNLILTIVKQRESQSYLKAYINLINEKFLRRQLINLGEKLIEWGYLIDEPIDKSIEKAQKEIQKIFQTQNLDKEITTTEALLETLEELQSLSKGKKTGYFSQYSDLDIITKGFQKTDMIILAGRPSMGKTALALNFAKNISEKYKLPVLFFSLEMSRKQIIYRLLSMESFVDSSRLRLGKITQLEWNRVLIAAKKLSYLNIYIEDNITITLNQIRSKIQKTYYEYNEISLVIIDYLQLIKTTTKFNNRVQEISFITRELKTIAKEFNLPLIVLSQLSRNLESRVNKRPILSDLRDSGCIYKSKKQVTSFKLFIGKKILKKKNHINYIFKGKKPLYKVLNLLFSSTHKIFVTQKWARIREISYHSMLLNFNSKFIQKFYYKTYFYVSDFCYPLYHNILRSTFLIHNSIEQDADIVLMIYRESYYSNKKDLDSLVNNQAELIIAKHRNGPVGFVDLVFDSSVNKFYSLE